MASSPAHAAAARSPERRLRCERLTSMRQLQALREEWSDLWRRAPQATPFQSWQWLLPWWRHLGEGTLLCIAVRDAAGELLGLAPWYIHAHRGTGGRHLFPVGMGTTDCLDLLARGGHEDEVAAAVMAELAACAQDWDVLEAPQLRSGAVLLRAMPPAGWQRSVDQGEPSPALVLQRDAAGRLALPPAIAANLRTGRNRGARAGRLHFETADAHSLAALLEALMRLHGQRWSCRGQAGVLDDERVQAMHREAAPLLLQAGLLRLHALRLDGRCIAALYALHDATPGHEARCAYYIGGFDPRHASLSPGSLLLAHAIELAAAQGAAMFDFLRGRETYKYRWGAVDQPMSVLRIAPAGSPALR